MHLYFRYLLTLLLAGLVLGFVWKPAPRAFDYPMKLSEYGFFQGDLSAQQPAEGVLPYRLNTPLFTDYASKLRFVKLPEGASVPYNDQRVLQFPVGTVIIKTFYYPHDARKPRKGRQLLETRLLIHEPDGWVALPYHWNEAQDEAVLEVAGDHREVVWRDAEGKKRKVDYSMPNLNQCKSCHSWDGALTPIGPSARQLNSPLDYGQGPQNQLQHWAELDLLAELPGNPAAIPSVPNWEDPQDGSTAERARAWLDINCAHCHNPHGPASTSGFFLDIHQEDPAVYGVRKTPVAAGRGSGGRAYDIHPGQPQASILVYRLSSTDPGVMMPEVGRTLVHEESLALIEKWIEAMEE
jgi:uncharacterized repeat protein (TIGR03806 family)